MFRSAYFPIPHRPTFGAPVFHSAYSASRTARASAAFAASIKPHRALFFKTLDLPPLRGLRWAGGLRSPLAAHRIIPSGYSGVPVGLFSDSAPTHLRCAGVPLGLFGKPKRSSFSRVRGLHQATPCSFLQNARPPAASRPPVGGGSFAPPCTPLSRPRAAGFFYPDKRWLCAGGRTERRRGWLPAQFLSLEEKRSHSRRGRRRRPLFPHGSCPARGRNHGGTLCTTKPMRTELVFRTHRLYSSGE